MCAFVATMMLGKTIGRKEIVLVPAKSRSAQVVPVKTGKVKEL